MNHYAFLMLAMSMDEAKVILGFPSGSNPSEPEVLKAWRNKAFKLHPDRGGDLTKMVEVNVAKDVLTGKQRPSYDRSSPSPAPSRGPTQPRWEKPKAEEVSFEEAKGKAGIPAGVEWQFVTDMQRGANYSSDEYYRAETSWVAYGKTESKHVFVAVHHLVYEQYGLAVSRPDKDVWTIRSTDIPIRGDEEGSNPAWLYTNVVKALRLVGFEGRFNSKVVDARSWAKFDERPPHGSGVSIKHWLVESGLVAEADPKVMSRKHVIEISYDRSSLPMPNHYQSNYASSYEAVTIICNGKTEYLNERDLITFIRGGLLRRIFGEYFYGGEKKNVTRMKNGKALLQTLIEHFSLSSETKATLEAAVAQMK